MRAIVAGAHNLAMRTIEPADPAEIQETFRQLREFTRIVEKEINTVVLDCARARVAR